uniref:Exostosin GT47 domain-containing protein n=1 Tax=Noctiluca scintillans TaxID=2966 RepID=A0A7S1F945_NOCSC
MLPVVVLASFHVLAAGGLRVSDIQSLPGTPSVFVDEFPHVFDETPSLASLNLDMHHIYAEQVCVGHEGFVASAAPRSFCRYEAGQRDMMVDLEFHPEIVFDQFATERVLLAKWKSLSTSSPSNVDVVVVPSFQLLQLSVGGFSWGNVNYFDHVKKSLGTPQRHDEFWNQIRQRHFNTSGDATGPIIVVHMPFTFDILGPQEAMAALARQPREFVDVVVVAAIESELPKSKRFFPSHCSDSYQVELARRLRWEGVRGCPLRVTVPYTTSILDPVPFAESDGSYNASAPRPIAVLLDAKESRSEMRNALARGLERHGARHGAVFKAGCESCAAGNMWENVVHSDFCLEPPGDTLTRSHFFVAVQSGCIPVLFEAGHPQYDESTLTSWPWRQELNRAEWSSLTLPSLDYESFAVVYNWTQIAAEHRDVTQELIDMPTKDPQRFLSLRRSLDQARHLLMYRHGACHAPCQDASTALWAVVNALIESKM